jgi:single-strand DNA-binding protein
MERKISMYQTLILIGNLGKDPDLRFTPGGKPVATLSLATNRRYNNTNGEPVNETTWFRITVWGKQAEACNAFLHKGSKVLVEGRLTPDPETGSPRIWENNGRHGASFEVTASVVRFLDGREAREGSLPDGWGFEPVGAGLPGAEMPF